jgi:ribosome biogenesis GTPase
MHDPLESYGWNPVFERASEMYRDLNVSPARVAETARETWTLIARSQNGDGTEELQAVAAGRFLHTILHPAEMPVTGDWVLMDRKPEAPAVIHAVLPRISRFSRKAKGDTAHDRIEEQVLVANIDTAIITAAAGKDWNPRRIERYIALVRDSGARPILVVTKADLTSDSGDLVLKTKAVAPGIPVFAVSALTGMGMDHFDEYLLPGATAVLIGSSGTGKSTLLNVLAGKNIQRVQDIRADDHKGRHTTTGRTLFRLPSGALLIDTPGLREIQLWTSEEDVDATFPDCSHADEPGCAVRDAVESGTVAADRIEAWRKLRREIEFLERRQNPFSAAAERARWRSLNRQFKSRLREKNS